jgi:hypothetical protein
MVLAADDHDHDHEEHADEAAPSNSTKKGSASRRKVRATGTNILLVGNMKA